MHWENYILHAFWFLVWLFCVGSFFFLFQNVYIIAFNYQLQFFFVSSFLLFQLSDFGLTSGFAEEILVQLNYFWRNIISQRRNLFEHRQNVVNVNVHNLQELTTVHFVENLTSDLITIVQFGGIALLFRLLKLLF
jgi:hypothetical protein